jgi:hypothetical protein
LENIYPCIVPFKESVIGNGKEREIEIFREINRKDLSHASLALSEVWSKIEEQNLKPTIEEYDIAILEGLENMTETGRVRMLLKSVSR